MPQHSKTRVIRSGQQRSSFCGAQVPSERQSDRAASCVTRSVWFEARRFSTTCMCRWDMTCCRSHIRSFLLLRPDLALAPSPECPGLLYSDATIYGFLRLFLVLAPNTQHGVSGDCISLQRRVMRVLSASGRQCLWLRRKLLTLVSKCGDLARPLRTTKSWLWRRRRTCWLGQGCPPMYWLPRLRFQRPACARHRHSAENMSPRRARAFSLCGGGK